MKDKVVETEHVKYWLDEGVLNATFSRNLVISLDLAQKLVDMRLTFCEGKSYPVLMDISYIASVDTASRKYLSSEKAMQHILAGGFLCQSLVSKLIGNIFVRIDRPKIPTRIFTDRNKAVTWLKQFKQ